jgi:uncharacterized protein YkwD
MVTILFSVPAHAQNDADTTKNNHIFLPFVANEPVVAPVEGAARQGNPCAINEQEAMLARLLLNDDRQNRSVLACDPVLAAVARAKARDMAVRNYFDHVNPDGSGPNVLIEDAGHSLPDSYSQEKTGNNVESIAAGFDTASRAWNGWLNSDQHRPHVLGEEPFFAQQTEYGVGYYFDPTSFYHHYWVVLTAHAD